MVRGDKLFYGHVPDPFPWCRIGSGHARLPCGILPSSLHVLHSAQELIMSGFEKRDNFVQNAKFWYFSSYHHLKAVMASDYILGLGAHQAFCFTNPTFEAVDNLLSEVVAVKPKVENGRFLTTGSMRTRHAHTGNGQGLKFVASVAE